MRKLLTTLLLAAVFTGVNAQKVKDVEEKFSKGKLDEAKEKIDEILQDPKNQNDAKAWYWKGKVYADMERLDTTNSLTFDAGREAFEAFKKYQELDPKNVLMALEQNVGLFQLYDLYYNEGIRFYNAKKYDSAFDRMKRAMEVEEYIAKNDFSYNGFSFPALDTQLVNLTAFSAYLAKMEDESIPYFEMLANAKISDKDYKEVYGLLAEYHLKNNNQAKADKYLAMGKEMFPDEDYWISLEFGNPGTDTLKRLARYQEMLTKYPDNYPLAMDYAIEVFNYTYSYGGKPSDYEERKARTLAALNKALELDPNSELGNYVMSQHIYNEIYDLEDEQRAANSSSAADVAKRKDLAAKINQKYEKLYPYALKTYELYSVRDDLKIQEKVNLRKAIDQLIDYHGRKKQTDKENFYKEELKKL